MKNRAPFGEGEGRGLTNEELSGSNEKKRSNKNKYMATKGSQNIEPIITSEPGCGFCIFVAFTSFVEFFFTFDSDIFSPFFVAFLVVFKAQPENLRENFECGQFKGQK
jgi:hypothetical protein